jgi:hypothetical protein
MAQTFQKKKSQAQEIVKANGFEHKILMNFLLFVYVFFCIFLKKHSQAQEIVKANGFEDKITLIHGRVEDVSLPVAKVDVTMSMCSSTPPHYDIHITKLYIYVY